MNADPKQIDLGEGDALIVVPPFAGLDRPSLAAHTLQACAAKEGFCVRVFYANLHLAALIGDSSYEAICFAPTSALLGERFFARVAYGTPALGRDHPLIEAAIDEVSGKANISPAAFHELEQKCAVWAAEVGDMLAASDYPVIGFSTTFEQTAASVALINRLKDRASEKIVLLGGANCEGEMAEGICSLGSRVDYIFSGESEHSFPAFLRQLRAGERPASTIVQGQICRDLDGVPLADYSEYFQQRDVFLPGSVYVSDDVAWLPYESSRGCWWGEKHHCTFCGINGQGMDFRQRSAGRVMEDLRTITARYAPKRICMTDNIMPHAYFRSLIPMMRELEDLYIFYEQKANLTLEQVVALRDAGVWLIQPGIEALSTDLLKRMDKGVTARQNIALLRYGRSAGIEVNWNLLYGFPGDTEGEYLRTLALLPYLRHLQPPSDLCRLSIDRFSPYHFNYRRYGIRGMEPMPSYRSVLPVDADVRRIAYHFVGDYDSEILQNEGLLRELRVAVAAWKEAWNVENEQLPKLGIAALSDDTFVLMDKRGIPGTRQVRFLNVQQAAAALLGHPMSRDDRFGEEAREWGTAVEYEGWHMPLATATAEVLAAFEKKAPASAAVAAGSLVQLGAAG